MCDGHGNSMTEFSEKRNVKAADKDLQFGSDQYKSMIVTKRNQYTFQTHTLSVDSWKQEHEENVDTKEA